MDSIKLRNWIAFIVLALAVLWVSPNFIKMPESKWLPSKKLNYGLDIQGGLHLVMGVDIAGVISESTNRLSTLLTTDLAKDGVVGAMVKPTNAAAGELVVEFSDASQKTKIDEFFSKNYSSTLQKMQESDTSINFKYYDSYMLDYNDRVLNQAIETVRNRIDEFGVAEPSISKQGTDRIIVQLPGMADAEQAKQLINTAAKLEFMIVNNDKSIDELTKMITDAETAGNYKFENMKYSEYIKKINQDLAGKLPEKTMIVFEKSENAKTMDVGRRPYLVSTDTGLGGEDLDDAFVAYDQYNRPEVSLVFNSIGANKFSTLTGNNVGRQMAVVLDKIVKSAPSINTKIDGGRAVITLGGSQSPKDAMEEAKMIATSLRAGSLPASLEQLEERRVGPSLGADSIKKAEFAGLMGAIIIFIFMILRYKTAGVISDITLLINVLSVIAILTTLGATLTLPGIAGIALTVGFAVDANVLINERIREELAKGSSFRLAVQEGYSRAVTAILDANITTGATALVLLYFGTGPVKGFAVTLLVGIVTTLFANVFVSRVIVDNLIHKFKVTKISI